MCYHLFVNPYCRSNSVALQPSNISHRNYRVRREFCRLKTLRKCLEMREINEGNPISPKIFRVKYPIPPKFCMSWSYHTPSLFCSYLLFLMISFALSFSLSKLNIL